MAKRKPVGIKDLFKLRMVSDPQVSPDGKQIAFVSTRFDYAKDEYINEIWMTNIRLGSSDQFTFGRGKDKSPRWSADGKKLLFVSTPFSKEGEEKKKPQLYVMSTAGGEARKITDIKGGVEAPGWSPDGKQVLFISPTEEKKQKGDIKHITRIAYKYNARGFFPGQWKRLYTIPVKGGKPKAVTQPGYDVQCAKWMHDGGITFVSNLELDADITGYQHIYALEGEKPRRLTEGTWHISAIEPSPDGESLAFSGHDYRKGGATKQDVWLIQSTGGAPIKLTGNLDADLGGKLSSDVRVTSTEPTPLWHPDGHIYFLTTYAGVSRLHRVAVEGGVIEDILGKVDHGIENWNINREGVMAYTNLSTTRPSDLWFRVEGKDRQLTDFNRAWIVGLDLRTHENFTFKSSGSHNVEGWIMKPSGYKKGKKYPMVVEIHGGPRAAYGNALMHEFQLLAGEGYAVMYINPYGSGGYTEDFQSGLPEHYGEQDYADIMEAVDYCIKTYDYVDAARLGVLGGSYGGFMTNWIVTHTDKFKAAVTMRSISNWVSFFGTSDIGWTFGLKEMGGIPWIDEEKYMVKSPIRYVKNVKTPTLILQSEEDYRCPMEQAEQFFTALKFLGVTTEFVRTPGENHELSRSGKPKHREARLEHIVRWFRTYL